MKNSVKAILLACMLTVTAAGLVWTSGKAGAVEEIDYHLEAARILQLVVNNNVSKDPTLAALYLAGGPATDSDSVPAETPASDRPATSSDA